MDAAHPKCVLVVAESGCELPDRVVELLAHAEDSVVIAQHVDEPYVDLAARVRRRASRWRDEGLCPDAAALVLDPTAPVARVRARAIVASELARSVAPAGGVMTLTQSARAEPPPRRDGASRGLAPSSLPPGVAVEAGGIDARARVHSASLSTRISGGTEMRTR